MAERRRRRSRLRRTALALAVPCGLACMAPATSAPRVLRTCAGGDWSLPADVTPTPGAGLFHMGVPSRHEMVSMRGFTTTWAELEPARGRYDWKPVRDRLAEADAEDFGVVLRVKASVTRRDSPWGDLRAVPTWALERHEPPRARTRDRGEQGSIEVAVPWHPGLQRDYLAFVEAFGRSGLARHPRLVGVYVHGISSSFGEEMWLDERGFRNLRAVGLSPERLRASMEARLRAWADAFGPERGKLAWVGGGWIDAGEQATAYRRVGDALDALALELGMGRRWGNIEKYNGHLDDLGQSLADDGRLRTDARHPLVAGGRFFGAENENWRGDPGREAFAYRRALLRALQMRMRQLWVSDPGIALDPELTAYFARVAGKGPGEAPDAWAVLRATEVRQGRERALVGNLERWLHEDDTAPRARSRAVRAVERPAQSNDWGAPREWSARATRRDAGSDRLAFELDPEFAAGGAPTVLQVTWRDRGTRWHVDAGGSRSPAIEGRGDGREKTTTFHLPGLAPDPAGPDLALVAEAEDLEVSVVRVLREAPEARDCPAAEETAQSGGPRRA